MCASSFSFFFFFNDTATTEIYTLSLHDALPILLRRNGGTPRGAACGPLPAGIWISFSGIPPWVTKSSARSVRPAHSLQRVSHSGARRALPTAPRGARAVPQHRISRTTASARRERLGQSARAPRWMGQWRRRVELAVAQHAHDPFSRVAVPPLDQ